MFCIIYKIVNLRNKKLYIGQTWSSLSHRWGQHISSKRCLKLANAIDKYGVSNFSIELITIAHTQEMADWLEDYFINKFDTIKLGYNIRGGGSRGKLSQATRQKISIANTGKKFTEATKMKCSLARKGKLGPNKGKMIPLSPGAGTPKGTKPWNTGTKGVVVAWNKGRNSNDRLFTEEQELVIAKDERSSRVLAKEYGVSRSHILNIRKRHKE